MLLIQVYIQFIIPTDITDNDYNLTYKKKQHVSQIFFFLDPKELLIAKIDGEKYDKKNNGTDWMKCL